MRSLLTVLLFAAITVAAPPEVAVVKPIEKEITDYADLTGRTEPSTSVEIRSRVTGYLDKVLFKEGSLVKKGDLLFQLDDHDQKAQLAKVEAEIKVAEAKLKIAEANLQRLMQLLKQAAIAKEEVEMASANLEAAKAGMLAARAALDVAKLNLESTRIASSINGHIGRCNVDAGNLVKGDGDTSLATVIVTDPLYVSFDMDERTVLRLMRMNRDAKEAKVTVGVAFGDEKDFPQNTTLDFMDNKVNAQTGTVRCRAVLANPKGELLPGMFAHVRIALGQPRKALLVPESSLIRAVGGTHVQIVTEKNRVEERAVKIGVRFSDLIEIKEGLTTSDSVIRSPRPRDERVPPAKEPAGDGGASAPRPLPELPINGPVLIVTAVYPGANAQTVEETVAGPISKQIAGMEGLVRQIATCTNGEMRLTLILKKGTDLRTAQVVAQDRVALALPTLPELVVRHGITVKKRPVHLLSLAVLSPNESRDRQFLAAYAEKQIKDDLIRVSGIGDVTFYGDTGPSPLVRIEFDRVKLAAFGLTLADAMHAVQAETTPSGLVRPGIALVDRPKSVDEMGDIVIKFVKEGQPLRLKDVATFEMVKAWNTTTTLDGKPCIMLLVSRTFDADEKETAKAVRERLKKLQKVAPEGLEMEVIDE